MANPYNQDLDQNPANYQPLTPLSFLERAADVFPEFTAIIHGNLRRSYADFYLRSKKLASALSQKGMTRGSTVSTLLLNTCLLYTSPSPRDATLSRMPSSA